MAAPFTLSLPPDYIDGLTRQEIKSQVAEYLANNPPADQQYSVPEVAVILAITQETVRGYFQLPTTHKRQLPHVPMTDTPRGWRVRGSDLLAWQQRNVSSSIPLELPVKRPSRRRP